MASILHHLLCIIVVYIFNFANAATLSLQLWRPGGFQGMYYERQRNLFFSLQKLPANFTSRKAEESREIPLHVPSPLILFIVAHLCMIIMYLAPPWSHPETK